MKLFLFLIVLFFSSFNLEYREKWVCHTIVESLTFQSCYVVVIRADTKEEAERKFRKYITKKEIHLGGKESTDDVHAVEKLKDAIIIEP